MSSNGVEAMLEEAARAADRWFPEGTFPALLARARAGVLAGALASLGEAPLGGGGDAGRRVGDGVLERLLVLPSFGGGPVVVEATRRGEGWRVRGAAALVGGEPPGVAPRIEGALEGEPLARYLAARARLGLHRGYTPSAREGHDGADWLLESLEARRYRAIREWCPRGPLRDLGSGLLEACGYLHVLGDR